MKRDRNSFFSEYGMSAFNNMPQAMPGIPGQVQSNSSFYAGPAMNTMNDNYTNEIESRISKIERHINRLESRINKLEGEYPSNYSKTTTDAEYNYSNSSMYMV